MAFMEAFNFKSVGFPLELQMSSHFRNIRQWLSLPQERLNQLNQHRTSCIIAGLNRGVQDRKNAHLCVCPVEARLERVFLKGNKSCVAYPSKCFSSRCRRIQVNTALLSLWSGYDRMEFYSDSVPKSPEPQASPLKLFMQSRSKPARSPSTLTLPRSRSNTCSRGWSSHPRDAEWFLWQCRSCVQSPMQTEKRCHAWYQMGYFRFFFKCRDNTNPTVSSDPCLWFLYQISCCFQI